MHEFSLAESMLSIVEDQLGHKARLASATVTVGPLAGIDAESLRFCFTEVARQEGFGEPTLVTNLVPARLHCYDCGNEYTTRDALAPCPTCGSMHRRIDSGQEFTLDSVELEDQPS
ncbi:MAG: hydrogenase maturation nickel metallochaperone HypA [Planctomycetota bacterium]